MCKYLYLRNGNIWTGDPNLPHAESLIIGNGKILAVGSTARLDECALASCAVKYELEGASVIPGMSDCHIHVSASAKCRHALDLSGAKSLDDVIKMLRERSAAIPPDCWIHGMMLNENNWDIPQLPTAGELDKADIPNPVILHRVCTHASVANARALELSDIAHNGNPNIERYSDGTPTGRLYDDAQMPVYNTMQPSLYPKAKQLDYLSEYLKYAASLGLTTLHTCSAESIGMGEELFLYTELERKGNLSCRVYCVHDTLSVPPLGPLGDEFVRYEGFKLFIDGAIGSRTAAMFAPYDDAPETDGILLHSFDELCEKLEESTRRGDHILVHAIGDRGIAQQLDALIKVRAESGEPQHPYLLNHVEICPPDIIEKMRGLNVACVIQPTYVPSDIDMVPVRLGAREKHACIWKTLSEAGILLCGSSDSPIEAVNPMLGIWALVNRTDWDGKRTWHLEEKLSLDEALKIYTVNPAKAYSTWDWNGSLTAGKAADVVIFDRDIFKTPPEHLRDVKVTHALLAGTSVFGHIGGWDD
ncbi:amidohydrolase [uncultured Cloacibacillus sp.]|uniref:amidohydrolase n=1 Tax=uncultured Cloacibacillus sp. TaxID=889794 RepID=UPI0026DC5B08|nr:amidohydrolase [uncultured Cloacibacillus sp.]